MKKIFKILLVICILMLVGGCSKSINMSSDKNESAETKNNDSKEDEKVNELNFDGSTACIPLLARVRSDYLKEDIRISRNLTKVSTTDYAWRNLITDAGRNKIVIAYEPSSETKEMLSYEGNPELLISAIGEDALVFITNANNKINNLSTENLQDIYTGKTENWKDVGGDDGKIEAFQRPLNSGSQTLFLNLLMKDKEPTEVEEKYISYGMDEVINAVASYKNTKNAIGYSVYYYAKKMYGNDDVKMISVDNVEPNDETISSEKYPYTNPFYIAIRADEPEDSDARKIYNMVTNMNYSATIKEEGYTPCKEVREVKFEKEKSEK